MAEVFTVGDRVRLRPEDASKWIDFKLQRRAISGTPGTITCIIGTALPRDQQMYSVQFDAIGRMRELSMVLYPRDLMRDDPQRVPCPDCEDGQRWTGGNDPYARSDGPCHTCNGTQMRECDFCSEPATTEYRHDRGTEYLCAACNEAALADQFGVEAARAGLVMPVLEGV